MKDGFHGSARPRPGLDAARREPHTTIVRPYHGSTEHSPRRGTAHTAPDSVRRALGQCLRSLPAITLDTGVPWGPIPCWTGRAERWATHTVPSAYRLRYDTHVRPAMPGNPISLKTLIAVAKARAQFADHRTGRDCRPTNATLATITGLSVRTVQRASTALRLLGVATEVMRGRQRSRDERYASWRVGDRGRGWASVWALHDSRITVLSPHPEGSIFLFPTSRLRELTTAPRRQRAGSSAATRRTSPDRRAIALANRWVCDKQSPPWARRYHTGTPWAHALTGPATHGWTPRDINQLISDWIGTGHWIPEKPHKPIGLLGRILACHGNLQDRPAAADEARERAELAQARQRQARAVAERAEAQRARAAGKAALAGPGHAAARQEAARLARRAIQRRTEAAASHAAEIAAAAEAARRPPTPHAQDPDRPTPPITPDASTEPAHTDGQP